jgi:hypothetical protein
MNLKAKSQQIPESESKKQQIPESESKKRARCSHYNDV